MSLAVPLLGALSAVSAGVGVGALVWVLAPGRTAVTALGAAVLRVLPASVSRSQAQSLLRADLDDRWTLEAWIACRALPVAFGVSGSIVAAAAGDGSVALLLVSSGLGLALVMGRYPVRRRLDNERRILNELPAYLDALTVCVEAGASLHAAFRITVEKAPLSPMRRVVERILQEIRLGRSRIESLNHVAALYDIEALGALFAALVQSEGQGMSLGGVLREQARQRATERQLRAEKAALKAPVKMLGPLVLCIFPCTFIVIAVPVVVRLMAEMR